MDELKAQVQGLNPEDWQTFLTWIVGDERDRREALPKVEQAVREQRAEDAAALWEAHPELKPAVVEAPRI